ncbi:transposase [Alicyclobacillus acidoterrestris]|uniref:transposase n=1 Tax=Alicyclobacillus acidoterrestris TaxID=1450 RepID=UPI0012682786
MWTQRIVNVKISKLIRGVYDDKTIRCGFQTDTVKLVLEEGKVASQVARDLGISQKTVYGWVAQYKNDPKHPFVEFGNLKPDAQATRDLERENRELREELEILKKKRCASSATTGSEWVKRRWPTSCARAASRVGLCASTKQPPTRSTIILSLTMC